MEIWNLSFDVFRPIMADPDSIFYINAAGSNGRIFTIGNSYEAVDGTELQLPDHFPFSIEQLGRPVKGSAYFQGNNTSPDTLWIHNGNQWIPSVITF